MRSLTCWIVLVVVLTAITSCSKSPNQPAPKPVITDSVADITSFTIPEISPAISLTPYSIRIRFADSIYNVSNLTPTFTLSPGAEATVNGIKQVSEVTKNNFSSSFYYTVTNTQGFSKRWTVNATNNDYSQNWGLGNFVKESVSNDRSYNWYYIQGSTGPFSDINCAPASTTMAMKWADPSYAGTVQNARDYYPQNTDKWSLTTVATFLADHKCPYKAIALGDSVEKTRNIMKAQLDSGHILVIAYSMYSIRAYQGASPDPRVDRYYPNGVGWGHCIVIYGYKEVDGEWYFQVNDPWGWDYHNKDGTYCGNGRFYRYEEIAVGCMNLDNNALVISKK